MGRPARIDFEGAIHHVFNRGVRRAPLFLDEHDYAAYLDRAEEVAARYEWRCLHFCLMPNHVHLVIETPRAGLSEGMRDLHGRHAVVFNRRHAVGGHVWETRFKSRLVVNDEYLAQLLRYVARNPVKARLSTTPAGWIWSAHRAHTGESQHALVAVARVTELLEPWGGQPGRRYARLFADDHVLARRYGDADPAEALPTLDDIFRGRPVDDAIRAAWHLGHSLAAIAGFVGLSQSGVSRRARA